MISVCIPTFNGEKFILQQLQSILCQLNKNDEVIVSDDSSSDNTISIVENIKDDRIKIFKNQCFKNPVYNMEFALKNAKGDFIFLSDQDDIWADNKVEKMIEHLKNYHLVVSDAIIVDENENILNPSYYSWKGSGKGFWKNFIKNSYIGCAIAFRKEILEYVLPFPKKIAMHDIWIGLVANLYFKVVFIDDKLLKYRRHPKNLTFSIDRDEKSLSTFSLKYKLYYRLVILFNVLLLIFKRLFKKLFSK